MDTQCAEAGDATGEDITAVTSADENRLAQRRTDALATLAESTLRHGGEVLSSAERYEVIVHRADTLTERS